MELRILFDCFRREDKSVFGPLRASEPCRFHLRIPKSCGTTQVFLVLTDEADNDVSFPLPQKTDEDALYNGYSGEVCLPDPGFYSYRFHISTASGAFFLYRFGDRDTNMEAGERWPLTVLDAGEAYGYEHRGGVCYQIFPDRFSIAGSILTDGKMEPFSLHGNRHERPLAGPDKNGLWNLDFFGGNLAGIQERLPYLASLGVETIYLNPIFKAHSNHRYDTADFRQIDPMLGTEADFSALCEAASKLGIGIILDGVFSHVGDDSLYFDRLGRFGTGAVSDPDSPYRSWFSFERFPDRYLCWWDVPSLPCVKEMEPSYLEYVILGEDSVVAHWMRLGASGFRLDVADELPDAFIRLLRRRVKELNPSGVVIGEVWEDASEKWSYGSRRHYFTGAELDGVMNYPFREAMLGLLLGNISPGDFVSQIMNLTEHYPAGAMASSMTLLSTHDTPRIRTLLSEALGESADRAIRCAAAIQFFLPGMPTVYYGDEVGMYGGNDPDNRRFYTVESGGEALLTLYRQLGQLRKTRRLCGREAPKYCAVIPAP